MGAFDTVPLTGRAALEAVASPARLEILTALGDGPMTAHEMALRLGRTRQALYYHLGMLERAGVVVAEPPARGGRERRFAIAREGIAIGARRESMDDRRAGAKVVRSILRLAEREASAALADPATRFDGPVRELLAVRSKARLTEPQLRRVNELIEELEGLLREADVGRPGGPFYALTVVLTPAREAGDPAAAGQED